MTFTYFTACTKNIKIEIIIELHYFERAPNTIQNWVNLYTIQHVNSVIQCRVSRQDSSLRDSIAFGDPQDLQTAERERTRQHLINKIVFSSLPSFVDLSYQSSEEYSREQSIKAVEYVSGVRVCEVCVLRQKSDSLGKLYEMDDAPERRGWVERLLAFMDERRTPIAACPTISKQPLDLYRLYLLVRDRGGFVEVYLAQLYLLLLTT